MSLRETGGAVVLAAALVAVFGVDALRIWPGVRTASAIALAAADFLRHACIYHARGWCKLETSVGLTLSTAKRWTCAFELLIVGRLPETPRFRAEML